MSLVAWNPSDIGSSVALSNGNLKWATTNAGAVSGRATLGYLAGIGTPSAGNANVRVYHEITVNVVGTSGQGTEAGFAAEGHSLADFLGQDSTSVCVDASTGDIFYLGGVEVTVAALIASVGTVYGIYLDILHQKIWWTVDGINFYGATAGGVQNPTTNQGGMFAASDMFYNSGYFTVFAAFGSRQTGSAATANFAGPFTLPVAGGFAPYQPGSPSQFFFAA